MKIEEGTVIAEKEDGLVEVKVGRHSDCMACGACPGAEQIVVLAVNPVGAKVGQHVKFEVREVNVIISAFMCFIMPLLVAAAGALAGHWIGISTAMDPTQTAIGGGIAGFLLGVLGVKLFDRSLTNDMNAKPKIVEISYH